MLYHALVKSVLDYAFTESYELFPSSGSVQIQLCFFFCLVFPSYKSETFRSLYSHALLTLGESSSPKSEVMFCMNICQFKDPLTSTYQASSVGWISIN